jgi:hypothetical protein
MFKIMAYDEIIMEGEDQTPDQTPTVAPEGDTNQPTEGGDTPASEGTEETGV